ncbi:hypothetical protein [Amnibacterium endophyticum]|uniref:DUF4352 domain-containing protein n=1 Tax=Amnibacterium endophyticum TaxID=2109337 RepID=A0ABW4LDK8_9MICO
MNAPASSRRARITTAAVGTGVAAVIAVTAFGAVQSSSIGAEADPTAAPSTSAPATSAPAATPSPVPTPGATVSTPITSDAPIRADLTAEVTSMKAVTVKTSSPGEIGGPGVRFAITVTNTTDRTVSLVDTVVNAAAGRYGDPAYLIDSSSRPFPSSVAAGRSVTGVYVFTIPRSDRGKVVVSLDTSTSNPVVAFTGKAPR